MTLEINNLGFRYKTKEVIRSIDLKVNQGEILSLVGPNGAGKTTLLKCINGLLKPANGTVRIEGKDTKEYSRMELAKKIAYVPQAELVRFPISVFDTILLGRRPYLNWRPRKHDLDLVLSIIEQMGLTDLAMRDMNQLSGGERQKVMIAKAIVQEPKVLLFDEPSTYLDLKYQLKMMEFIREIVDEKQISAVMTTHDLNLAVRYSDQLAVLKSGEMITSGSPDILSQEIIHDVYEVRALIRQEEDKPFVVPLQAM